MPARAKTDAPEPVGQGLLLPEIRGPLPRHRRDVALGHALDDAVMAGQEHLYVEAAEPGQRCGERPGVGPVKVEPPDAVIRVNDVARNQNTVHSVPQCYAAGRVAGYVQDSPCLPVQAQLVALP